MKQLIEEYKRRLKFIDESINKAKLSHNTNIGYVTRICTKASVYRDFVAELQALQSRDAGKMVNENGTKNC